jgi:tetratricopeptide (TPR) repeat protein
MLAVCSLVCAAILFRPQLGDALIIRGDDYLYRGDSAQALERYRRALAIAPFSQAAVDRYIFVSIQRQTPGALSSAVEIATRYLSTFPDDETIRADRALCYLHLRRYVEAQLDFEHAAHTSNSATDYVFAGWAAKHAGQRRAAQRLWRQALTAQPHFGPARLALAELR